MDYIRISSQQSAVSGQGLVAEPVEALTAHSSQLTAKDVKELLKDWIKLYQQVAEFPARMQES